MLDKLEFDVQLDPELDLAHDRGFSPATIKGRTSGFEIDVLDTESTVRDYPALAGTIVGRSPTVCFRWGGDLAECACVMAAAAAVLAGGWSATAYAPADDTTYDIEALIREYHSCLAGL
jgi:hypothetical protein